MHTLMREIEHDYGLEAVPSRAAERHAPTKGELERTLRTGEPSTRQQLQVLCDGAAQDCDSFTAYQERLAAVGVEIIPTVQQRRRDTVRSPIPPRRRDHERQRPGQSLRRGRYPKTGDQL